jgi:hypothetical protein
MAGTNRYDVELRAIGQALEARDISVFELKRLGDHYIVRGEPDQAGSHQIRIRHWLRRLRRNSTSDSITLGLADVQRLDQMGRAKRSAPGRLPSFQNVSTVLRTIGAYLDSKAVELLALDKRRISLTLSYRDQAGQEQTEDRTIASFHTMFVELCRKRRRLEAQSKD